MRIAYIVKTRAEQAATTKPFFLLEYRNLLAKDNWTEVFLLSGQKCPNLCSPDPNSEFFLHPTAFLERSSLYPYFSNFSHCYAFKLSWFFRRVLSRSESRRFFGRNLDGSTPPQPVLTMIDHLLIHGIQIEGLFRKSPKQTTVRMLKVKIGSSVWYLESCIIVCLR